MGDGAAETNSPLVCQAEAKRGFAASTEIAAIAKNGTGIDQGQGELDPGAHGPGPVPGWQPAASAANNRPIEAVKPETGIGPGNALGQIAIESSAAGVAHYCAFTLIQFPPRHFSPMKGRRRDGAPAAPPAAECAGQQAESTGREDNSVVENIALPYAGGRRPVVRDRSQGFGDAKTTTEDRDLLSALRGLVSWAVI